MSPDWTDPLRLLAPYVLPIYRYHLLLRGDGAAALALTSASLRSALTWLDTYRPTHTQDGLAVWLFSIARYKQAYTARWLQRSQPLSSERPTSEVDQNPQPAPDVVPLWQAQLSWLADALHRLPPQQSEALALVCFGGLSPVDAALLLQVAPRRIQQILTNPLADPKQLEALAGQINLTENEFSHILNEAAAQPASHPAWLKRNIWRQAVALRAFLNKIIPAAGLAAVLLWAFINASRPVPISYQPPPINNPQAVIAADTLYNLASDAPRQIQSGPGYLVPPDLNECLYWQGYLKKALSQPPDLIQVVPFQNPQASGPSEHGTGCELDLKSVTASSTAQLQSFFPMIQPFFTREDYSVASLKDCGALLADKSWSCQGQVYSLQSYSRVVLALSRPAPAVVTAGAGCAGSADVSTAACPNSLPASQFTLRMQIASNPTQLVVDNFLARWKNGDDLARDDFTSQMLIDLPSISELDKLAHIDRGPAGGPSFSVQVTQNSGSQLLVQVLVDEIRTAPLPSEPVSNLQVKLVRLEQGWKIQGIKSDPLIAQPGGSGQLH
ncbi:MAG: sigma-70 family RNA polymerase sigma factor [Anaerolineaceae bacterium]|nr:sigma-70 family RNA polymerase sigma factor [Anaerolineaceae bacterium]